MRHGAEMAGATVIDRVSVIITHLSSVISEHAPRLLSREDVRVLTDAVKQVNPAAVEELIPNVLSLAEVQRVLQGLLSERVPINDLARIYEALALRAKVSPEADGLIEAARTALGPRHRAAAPARRQAPRGHDRADARAGDARVAAPLGGRCADPLRSDAPRGRARLAFGSEIVEAARQSSTPVALVCAPALRPAVRRMVATQRDGLPVLSYQEAAAALAPIETVGVVRVLESGCGVTRLGSPTRPGM